MTLPRVVQLVEYQSGELFELDPTTLGTPRVPGTYVQVGETVGNSILSSVFVEAIDPGATLKINYYDTTTGAQVGERFELTGHDLITDALAPLTTLRILVTRIHHRIVAEAVVTGGNVKFSLYATVVSSTASDLDQSLIRDGDTWLPTITKALPVACLNELTGEMEFIRCPLKVVVTGDTSAGTPYYLRGEVACAPGTTQTVFTDTVPALTTRYLKKLWVTAFNDGQFSLLAGGLEVAAGLISNVQHNISFSFDPPRPISPGVSLELEFSSDSEPNYPCPVIAFLSGSDIT